MKKFMPRKFRESDFQTKFHHWIKYHGTKTMAFELKVTEGTSIPFDAVEEHQLAALLAAKSGKLFYKIPDDSVGAKPFDCFMLVGVQGVIVMMFRAKERGQKEFFIIGAEIWKREQELSDRKSLTEERAGQIGHVYKLGVDSLLKTH